MVEDGELNLNGMKKVEDEGPNSWQVLVDSRYRCATGIAVTLACFNQLSGLNAINFYSGVIFKEVLRLLGYSPDIDKNSRSRKIS